MCVFAVKRRSRGDVYMASLWTLSCPSSSLRVANKSRVVLPCEIIPLVRQVLGIVKDLFVRIKLPVRV